jgi:aryl-alcohol dehydrogenase-like predicted oxidoreductase
MVERLKRIAKHMGKSPGQVALRWLLDTPGVGAVLFGAKRPEQVTENAAAAEDWRLSAEDYHELDARECQNVRRAA